MTDSQVGMKDSGVLRWGLLSLYSGGGTYLHSPLQQETKTEATFALNTAFLHAAAAAAAKPLQSCPTLHDPIDGSPPGSAIPGILQARTLEWVAISFSSA